MTNCCAPDWQRPRGAARCFRCCLPHLRPLRHPAAAGSSPARRNGRQTAAACAHRRPPVCAELKIVYWLLQFLGRSQIINACEIPGTRSVRRAHGIADMQRLAAGSAHLHSDAAAGCIFGDNADVSTAQNCTSLNNSSLLVGNGSINATAPDRPWLTYALVSNRRLSLSPSPRRWRQRAGCRRICGAAKTDGVRRLIFL